MSAPANDMPADTARSTPRIEIQGLGHNLGWKTVLEDVSFSVDPGELVGILGPNGSGKSSLIRCLTGAWGPELGTLKLDGERVDFGARAFRARLGIVFQEPSLDSKLTARENLELGARLFGVGGSESRARAAEMIEFMELSEQATEQVKNLSGGMRRRLEIGRALIHKPDILLLDEPTTGLDVAARQKVWGLIEALRRSQGLTVLVSTHDSQEGARCDRLVVIDRGHVVDIATPAALLAKVSGDVVTLETAQAESIAQVLRDDAELDAIVEGGQIRIEHPDAHGLIPRIVESFAPGTFSSLSVHRPTLDDAFLKLTGSRLDGELRE